MTLAKLGELAVKLFGLSKEAIQLLNNVLQAITGVQNLLGDPAQQHSVDDVLTDTDTIITMLNDPTIGLAFIVGEIQAQAVGILTAINGLPQVGDPVVLPTTPPAGYGSSSDATIFNAVWNGLNSPDVTTPYEWLRATGTREEFLSGSATLAQADGNFSYYNQLYDQFGTPPSFYPTFDLALLAPSDDLLSFVTTCNPAGTCFWSPSSGLQVEVHGDNGDGTAKFLTTWNNASFLALKASVFPLASSAVPPTWPGLSGVTLGTPVAISAQMTITEPMDGVIVSITSVTVSKPTVPYDSELAYKFIGGLAFVSDNGDVEPFQTLAFTHALYSPRLMAGASAVVVRADPSVVGTVTPWVIV